MFTPEDHTFILCAYGASPYLEECLKSLLSQTVKTNVLISTSTPNEHIVEIAESYGVGLFTNDGAPSISYDWNCAISRCATPLVTIAHQDDVYLPSFVEETLSAFNVANTPLIAFTDYFELREGRRIDRNRLLNIKRLLLFPLRFRMLRSSTIIRRLTLSVGSPICCPSVTYCVNNLSSPYFLSGMKSNLDWEAWERFSKVEGAFLYIPKILMGHRIHDGSETTALIQDETRAREDLAMLGKFWPKQIASFINRFYASGMDSNRL